MATRLGKRGQNEGSVIKRADGRWEARLTTPTGRRSFYGRTKEEAWDKLKRAERQIQQGLNPASDRLTVKQWVEYWLDEIAPIKLAPQTLDQYRRVFRVYIEPKLGSVRLTKLTAIHAQDVFNAMIKDGYAPRTIHYAKTVLSAALNHAQGWGMVERNVARLAVIPPRRKREREAMSADDGRAILAAFANHPLGPMVTLALACGTRQGELIALRWEQVDFDQRTMRIVAAAGRSDHGVVIGDPKTKSSVRVIPLPTIAIEALRRQKALAASLRLLAGPAWEEHGLVFPNTTGKPLASQSVLKRFKARLAEVGLPTMTFHNLRHGTATLLAEVGVHPRVVMQVLGHASIGQTLTVYTHATPRSVEDALRLLDQELRAHNPDDDAESMSSLATG